MFISSLNSLIMDELYRLMDELHFLSNTQILDVVLRP